MARQIITLKTTDGETLDYAAVEEPLPDKYQWRSRTFKRFVGPDNYYLEIEGGREWPQAD